MTSHAPSLCEIAPPHVLKDGLFDISPMPSEHRADALMDYVRGQGKVVEPVEPGMLVRDNFTFRAVVGAWDKVLFCCIACSELSCNRTRPATSDSEPGLAVSIQLSGIMRLSQGDNQVVVYPGDILLYDPARPFYIRDSSDSHKHFFWLSTYQLGIPPRVLHDLPLIKLNSAQPFVGPAFSYLAELSRTAPLLNERLAPSVASTVTDMIRLLIAAQIGDGQLVQTSLQETLQVRVLAYLKIHLADPGLTATQVAQAHHVSVRHLHRVMADAGLSYGQWVREQRLQGSRDELVRPETATITVAAIGRRWGFTDPTNFGRAFRAQYGMSPGQWREANAKQHRGGD